MGDDGFNHPIRDGAVLKLNSEEPGIRKIVFVTSRLLDIDSRTYYYRLVDYSNTYEWQYHEDDIGYIFKDTGHTSTETKIYKAVQPGLYETLTREYGSIDEFPNGTPH